jgi:hypothetical protein
MEHVREGSQKNCRGPEDRGSREKKRDAALHRVGAAQRSGT